MAAKLIVLVEEPSMEAALELLLPRMTECDFEFRRFQCKDDLLNRLPALLQGYRTWLPTDWALIVVVDRDEDDCHALKKKLEMMAFAAGLKSKTAAGAGTPFQIANRIAVEELEAWFFGDWAAVKTAYPRVPETIPNKAPFRDPDGIKGGTWEALLRVLQGAGYFKTGLRKVEFARSVAQHMDIEQNTSPSFQRFREAVAATGAW